ncbi:MAG: DNA repair protein RadC [Clostridia bacterium]|nr:DNA repair protein RadC [Clostridia bacterium]
MPRKGIKDLPTEERPRERLEKYGAQSLSNAELLAILLRTGTHGLSALDLATTILAQFQTLDEIAAAGIGELSQIKGLGQSKAVQILAAFELGRRLQVSEVLQKGRVSSPGKVAELVMPRLRFLKQEHFLAIHLNTKNRVLAIETISIGTLDSSLVHPREVFRAAIKNSSASLILVHNHPSGEPYPSNEDLNITRRLKESGELLGIPVLDHIIIGGNKYISLREEGLW